MFNRFAFALMATASMLPFQAHAQESTNSDEIVVTAQKREELLREVPQSVTAITSDTLERIQANDFSDYASRVPGMTVDGTQAGNSRITLRGLNTEGVASTVGVYVDETPFGSSTSLVNGGVLALDLDPYDIQRIEVLRGPQGTLYGANTLGGLIKFVTTQPSPDRFEARINGSAEQTEDGDPSWTTRAMLNIPLGDQAALRISGLRRYQGGYVDDPTRNVSNINDVDTSGVRAAFLLRANDDLTIHLSGLWQEIDSGAPSSVAYFQSPLEPAVGDLNQPTSFSQSSDITYRIFNATIDWNLGWASLVSSSSYGELDQHRLEDGTLPFGTSSYLINDVPQNKTTQELRLVSPQSDRLDWLLGAFYTRERGTLDQEIFFGTPPGTASGLTANIASRYSETAFFGGFTYHFTPQFDVNVGARYAYNDQSMNQTGTAVSNGSQDSSDNATTYSVAPRFRLDDNTILYARVATGYRPGGPNILGVPSVIPLTFGPDRTTDYEVGVKTDLFNRALRLDAAAFYIDWTHIQLLVFDGAVSGNANGSSAVSEGVEWSATLTPTHGFTIVWSGAYTDAHLTGDTDPIVVGGVDGDPLPYAPDWTSTVDVDYEWSTFGGATAFVGGAWRYVGEQSNGFPGVGGFLYGAEQIHLPSYNVFDLRGGIDFDRFTIELYAKNVSDERAVTQFGGFGQSLPDLPNGSAVVLRPRTIGISLGARF